MVWHLIGIEIRRHRRSVVLVAALVALVLGTVLACVDGARRARTSFARYVEQIEAPDLMVFGDPDTMAKVDDVPGVAASLPFDVPAAFVATEGYYPLLAASDARILRDHFRYRVVAGRLPDPSQPLELVVSERTADSLGVDVGDAVPIETMSPRALDLLNETEGEVYEVDGPSFEVEVVGIVRDLGDIASRASDLTITYLTPAWRERFPVDEVGVQDSGRFIVVDEDTDPVDVSSDLAALGGDVEGILGQESVTQQVAPTMRAIATALLVFAAVAGLAGLATIAHALARLQQTSSLDDRNLSALGVAASTRWARLAGPGLAAVVIGVPLGVVVAIGGSVLLPVGVARKADPDLGVHADAGLLGAGAVTAVVLISAVVLALAAVHARANDQRVSTSTSARVAAGLGASAPVVTGLTFATARSRRYGSTGRAAVIGTAAGVLGTMAALLFATNIDTLVTDPHRYGWGWDATIAGAETSGLGPRAERGAAIVGDDDLEAVADVVFAIEATVDGVPEAVLAVRDVKGHIGPVLVEGAEPRRDDEIALGRASLRQLGKEVGSAVEVDLGTGPEELRVTGVVALPVSEDGGSSATGAYLTGAAADRLGFDGDCGEGDDCYENVAVTLADGADVADVIARYEDEEALVAVDLPTPPGEVERLQAVESLPRYLAVFLVVLAATAIAYAAGTTVRRRRGDLAMLRVLGMTTRQLRSVVVVHVLALTALGALIGAGLGVATGRQVWRLVVDSIPLPFLPSVPVAQLLLVPLAALLLAQVAGTFARLSAGRTQPALALRAE